jgi:hypothetical protein
MDKFSVNDTVFITRTKKFCYVYEGPAYIESIEEGCIRVTPMICSSYGYFIYPVRELILVNPDTPQNRLAIQIKHG